MNRVDSKIQSIIELLITEMGRMAAGIGGDSDYRGIRINCKRTDHQKPITFISEELCN